MLAHTDTGHVGGSGTPSAAVNDCAGTPRATPQLNIPLQVDLKNGPIPMAVSARWRTRSRPATQLLVPERLLDWRPPESADGAGLPADYDGISWRPAIHWDRLQADKSGTVVQYRSTPKWTIGAAWLRHSTRRRIPRRTGRRMRRTDGVVDGVLTDPASANIARRPTRRSAQQCTASDATRLIDRKSAIDKMEKGWSPVERSS